eukprot:SAG31_NODE_3526_length_4156_cov_1.726645_1_plen_172_part_00
MHRGSRRRICSARGASWSCRRAALPGLRSASALRRCAAERVGAGGGRARAPWDGGLPRGAIYALCWMDFTAAAPAAWRIQCHTSGYPYSAILYHHGHGYNCLHTGKHFRVVPRGWIIRPYLARYWYCYWYCRTGTAVRRYGTCSLPERFSRDIFVIWYLARRNGEYSIIKY